MSAMYLDRRAKRPMALAYAGDWLSQRATGGRAPISSSRTGQFIFSWSLRSRTQIIGSPDESSVRTREIGAFSLASVWSDCYSAAMPDGRSRVNTSSSETMDDRALLRAIAARDKEAFRQLYTRHSTMLFSLAIKILSDRAEAEDVLQEIFVQIWKTASSFDDGRGKPLGWFIMLARSRAIDRLRSRKTRNRLTESAAQDGSQNSPAATPSDEAAASEAQRAVRNALSALPAEQRVPIEMAYFGGLTQFEISQQLSQPLGTVKTRMRSGIMRLREQLGSAASLGERTP
jgi:RNA polymerase sigma-70 factor, ECF subfamily